MLPLPDDFYDTVTTETSAEQTLGQDMELPGTPVDSGVGDAVRKERRSVPSEDDPGVLEDDEVWLVRAGRKIEIKKRTKCWYERPSGDPPLAARYANGCEVYGFKRICARLVSYYLVDVAPPKLLGRTGSDEVTWRWVRVCPGKTTLDLGPQRDLGGEPSGMEPGGNPDDYFWVPPAEKDHAVQRAGWEPDGYFHDEVHYKKCTKVEIDPRRCRVTVTYALRVRRSRGKPRWYQKPDQSWHYEVVDVQTTDEPVAPPVEVTEELPIPGCG